MRRTLVLLMALAVWDTLVGTALVGAESWLDQKGAQWNRAGASVPRAPKAEGAAQNLARCGESGRPPTLAADRSVRAAGWTLFGPAQVFGATTLVMAMADVDGMCRPLHYQVFVFVEGRLAGTLSPVPMDSRTDGALSWARLYRGDEIVAEYSRYASTDALCCPSRMSTVVYRIERTPQGAIMKPASVTTTAPQP